MHGQGCGHPPTLGYRTDLYVTTEQSDTLGDAWEPEPAPARPQRPGSSVAIRDVVIDREGRTARAERELDRGGGPAGVLQHVRQRFLRHR